MENNNATGIAAAGVILADFFLVSMIAFGFSGWDATRPKEDETIIRKAALEELHGELARHEKQHEEDAQAIKNLTDSVDEARKQNNELSSKLQQAKKQLIGNAETIKNLTAAFEQEKATNTNLKATLQQIAGSSDEADKNAVKALAENARLRAQNESLKGQLKNIEREKRDTVTELQAVIAGLNRRIDQLNNENALTRKAIARIESEKAKLLADAAQDRKDHESEVAALKKQIDDLTDDVMLLTTRNRELTDRVAALLRASTQQKERIARLDEMNDDLVTQLRRLESERTNLIGDKTRLERLVEQLAVQAKRKISPDLLGLRGGFKKAVIMVDASYSMKGNTGKDGDRRWEYTHGVITTWLDQLRVEQCALVVFNDSVRMVYPEVAGTYLPVGSGDNRRHELTEALASVSPKGETNTLDAFRVAYENYRDADTIVLFTDGRPELESVKDSTRLMIGEIERLCKQHPNIPVNTVGLGNYFEPQLSAFLLRIAELTNGSFQGR